MNVQTMTFRKAIHLAIREANLTSAQRVALNTALLLPGKRRRLENRILIEAKLQSIVYDSLAMDADAQLDIDWEKIKKFIKDYLPTIISLLMLFLL